MYPIRARDDGAPRTALQLLLYPVTDYPGQTRSQTLFARGFFLTRRDMDWFHERFLGGAQVDAADPRVSPLRADDLSALYCQRGVLNNLTAIKTLGQMARGEDSHPLVRVYRVLDHSFAASRVSYFT